MKYLHFRVISKQKTKYGDDILIKQVQLRDDQGKFIRNVKINDALIDVILKGKLKIQ